MRHRAPVLFVMLMLSAGCVRHKCDPDPVPEVLRLGSENHANAYSGYDTVTFASQMGDTVSLVSGKRTQALHAEKRIDNPYAPLPDCPDPETSYYSESLLSGENTY